MALKPNPKSRFIPANTGERHGRPLKPEDFQVRTNQKQIFKNDGKAALKRALKNCRRRRGTLERGRGPSRRRSLVGITFSNGFVRYSERAYMDSDPEQAADRHARAITMAIFAVILAVAIVAAFVTTLEGVDTRRASDVTQPGTIGLAKPHPPLDRAPGDSLRN
jgi:hypothetical protein